MVLLQNRGMFWYLKATALGGGPLWVVPVLKTAKPTPHPFEGANPCVMTMVVPPPTPYHYCRYHYCRPWWLSINININIFIKYILNI